MKQLQCAVALAVFAAGVHHSLSLHLAEEIEKPSSAKKPSSSAKKPPSTARKLSSTARKLPAKRLQRTLKWVAAPPGQACSAACGAEKVVPPWKCKESEMAKAITASDIKAFAVKAGEACDASLPILETDVPSIFKKNGKTQCFRGTSTATCETDSGLLQQLCPCFRVESFGDPHMTNMHGEFFDINRAGISTFLELTPKGETTSGLRVEASVEHPGSSPCFGYYIRKLAFKGSFVGEDIVLSVNGADLRGNDSLAVQVGDTVMRNGQEVSDFLHGNPGKYNMTLDDERSSMAPVHANNRVKFATLRLNIQGAEFVVDWSTGKKKPNILGFRAGGLKQLGQDWRGLLASDDHTWVSSFEQDCQKSRDYADTAQLLQLHDDSEEWSASAQLD